MISPNTIRATLFSLATLMLSAFAPASAQKSYAANLQGVIYEVDFGTLAVTPLGNTGLSQIYGIEQGPTPGTLYITQYGGAVSLLTLSPLSVTPLGQSSPVIHNITYNDANGQHYATDWNALFTIDLVTQAATLVGNYQFASNLWGLEYHPGLGKFITCNFANSGFYEVDPVTGQSTVIGAHGASRVVEMWYDHKSGRTFGLTDVSGGGNLLEFDVYTGAATVLSSTGIGFVSLGGVPEQGPFNSFCFGDGSGTPCPCGNNSASAIPAGCVNSANQGALLAAYGTTSVAEDDLFLSGSGLLPGKPALAFFGTNDVNGGLGAPFGDGLRCAGGQIKRLTVQIPGANGVATWGPQVAATYGLPAGVTRNFQVWYRDPSQGPCGMGFNLTNGVGVTFTP